MPTSRHVRLNILAALAAIGALCILLLVLASQGGSTVPIGERPEEANRPQSPCGSRCGDSPTIDVNTSSQVTSPHEETQHPNPEHAELENPPKEPDKGTPQPFPVKTIRAVSPPTPWNADADTYRALSANESLPASVRSDARAKLRFRFDEWRGREADQLGGFEFEPESMGLLSGWDFRDSIDSRIQVRPQVQPTHVERVVGLTRGEASLFFRIQVAISVGWAHQLLLESQLGSTSGLTHLNWGDLNGTGVGDVWFSDKSLDTEGAVSVGVFAFVRRNVCCYTQFNNNGSTYTLDMIRLARELDAQIREQGVSARDWEDVSDVCPKILQLEADTQKLPARGGLRTAIKLQVAAITEGDTIQLLTSSDGLVLFDAESSKPYVEVSYFDPDSVPEEPFTSRCWLVAVNTRNLLFSVAELTFTLERP